MFNQYILGDSFAKIAKDHGISRARASAIVHKEQRRQHVDLNPWSKQRRDEQIAVFGTWANFCDASLENQAMVSMEQHRPHDWRELESHRSLLRNKEKHRLMVHLF
jgi:hypothetical protein